MQTLEVLATMGQQRGEVIASMFSKVLDVKKNGYELTLTFDFPLNWKIFLVLRTHILARASATTPSPSLAVHQTPDINSFAKISKLKTFKISTLKL